VASENRQITAIGETTPADRTSCSDERDVIMARGNGLSGCFFSPLIAMSVLVSAWAQGIESPGTHRSPRSGLTVRADGQGNALSLANGKPFHRTANEVTDERLIEVPGSPIRLALWVENVPDAGAVPFYAITLDGHRVATVRRTSYALKLRHGGFDPAARVPQVEASLAADESNTLYIVQFVTQPLQEFRTAIEDLGGTVRRFVANHAHVVQMSPDVREQVEAIPFVRRVVPYHPAYRLEEFLLEEFKQLGMPRDVRRYHIQVVESDVDHKNAVGDRIRSIGGKVEAQNPDGNLLDATLDPHHLLEIVRMNEVFFIDRQLPRRVYMNNVREDGGANHVETVGGYTGEGVRGEVMDTGLWTLHSAFQARPPIIHHCNFTDTTHGTSVYGINFGDGTGDADGRGLAPDAQGIFSAFYCLEDRYQHTVELVQDPYYAVYQTNSWGSCCTTEYGTDSTEMDRIIFDTDLLILQAQANEGSRDSDVSAWAKNVVSVGGIYHHDTLSRADDEWSYTCSIGPAADGRVKPDLSYWCDSIRTTSDSGGYTPGFGGTSAATPETAGHFGLFFQMWANGIFGNDVDPSGTVFDNRCHMSTAKAVLINTARQYTFSGADHDLTRIHQGWGTANVARLYDMRDKISVIDETDVLTNLETITYYGYVDPGEPALRVTMVYTDPPGTTSSSQHRINDLTLKVTSPSDVVYWGNNGLLDGNWSTPGGAENTIDTVENVFIENPEAGLWTVEVIASEINEDSHVETPELDADFALVFSGGLLSNCSSEGRIRLDAVKYACADQAAIRVVDCDLNTDDGVVETITVTIDSDTEPGGETLLLTETGPPTADFRGTIELSTSDASGVLQVSESDVVTAAYLDADDGQGGVNVVVTDAAVVDCTPPQISNVQTTNIEARNATVTFDTNEPAWGTVRYGGSCDSLNEAATQGAALTEHTVNVSGLSDNTTYFYAVDAVDEAGNARTDDNGGVCHTFTTLEFSEYFTEQFRDDFDLNGQTVTFTPNGSADFYYACRTVRTDFPTDPTGGVALNLGDDDYRGVTLSGGETVHLYATSYDTFYIGSNGYITFTSGDSEYWGTLDWHFVLPRISALFVDLNPSSGGTVSWRQLPDRVAVTWQDVPQYGTSNSNSFQVEMFFDGTIGITWLQIDATSGISGLAEGSGLPPDFYESDLGAVEVCEVWANTPVPETGGPACAIDSDCTDAYEGALCIAGTCYAPKNRYISIDPTTSGMTSVALRVELTSMRRCTGDDRRSCVIDADCPSVCDNNNDLQCADDTICGGGSCIVTSPCVEHSDVGAVTKWVDAPFISRCIPLDDCAGQWFANLTDTPTYRVWTEDTLHITDCQIVPVAMYDIRATVDGAGFSDPLTIGTIKKPQVHYGDCVGSVVSGQYTPPDGFTNVNDVQAYLIANQCGSTAPHTIWLDLHSGSVPIVPQQILNVGDLQTIKFGILGRTYVETPGHSDPGDCP